MSTANLGYKGLVQNFIPTWCRMLTAQLLCVDTPTEGRASQQYVTKFKLQQLWMRCIFSFDVRLQNSPYSCVFKYTRAVKQKVWNKAENYGSPGGAREWFRFYFSLFGFHFVRFRFCFLLFSFCFKRFDFHFVILLFGFGFGFYFVLFRFCF